MAVPRTRREDCWAAMCGNKSALIATLLQFSFLLPGNAVIYFSCGSEDSWGNWGVSLCSAAQVSESERVGEDQDIM